VTAVELPVELQIALADYPSCEARTERPGDIVEVCAIPSEWAVSCNACGRMALLCDEHASVAADIQRPKRCPQCGTVGIVAARWTFTSLRRTS
jgi:hypothetical protein